MKDYEQQITELTYEINKYKKAITDSGLDYYDFNLDTGEAEQSFIIGKSLGLEPDEYDTIEKRKTYFHPDDLKRNYDVIDRIITGEIRCFDVQSRLYRKDGSILWIQHSGTLSRHPLTGEKHLVGLLRDITQEKANIESIKYLADYDGLTGAYNRRSGLEKLDIDVKACEAVTIIFIDIDEFKCLNDNYGHAAGDQALKMFCNKIKGLIPEGSYLIRLGGDEFLCALLNQLEVDAKEIVAAFVRNPVIYGNHPEDKLFFSYGIATFDQSRHENVDELIHDADKQMYTFKNSGRR
jgi:diguanylate cyclase (GGDEF)-like protein/PAS domain S-box-containing protein